MRMNAYALIVLALGLACGGCGGHYILTVPDQVATPGGQAVAVARLQRNDFFVLANAIDGAAMRFRFVDGPQRGAYTDRQGYAGASVPAPAQAGKYEMLVSHLDREGDEVEVAIPAYVWPAQKPVVAVDLDVLSLDGKDSSAAQAALVALSAKANILYLTDRKASRHAQIHADLSRLGYPDGPVLLWQRESWHITYAKGWIPMVHVETRLVSQLASLRQTLPRLEIGVTQGRTACKAFLEAGMRCVVLGPSDLTDPKVEAGKTWESVGKLIE